MRVKTNKIVEASVFEKLSTKCFLVIVVIFARKPMASVAWRKNHREHVNSIRVGLAQRVWHSEWRAAF